jgi:hypothetical protein
MSEGDWSSEGRGLEPPKRRVPLWVWGCGGGCALVLLVGVIVSVLGFRMIRKMGDPELNWAAIGAALPVVERPEDYVVWGMPVKFDGVQIWMLQTDSHQIVLFHGAGGDGTEETRRELFGSSASSRSDAEPGTLAVQGRELRLLRHRTVPGGSGSGGGGISETLMKPFDGANATVELSLPEGPDFLAMTYTRPRTDERVQDEELIEFLSHFRLPGGTQPPPAVPEPANEPAAGEGRDG